jgi:hypothetical protein
MYNLLNVKRTLDIQFAKSKVQNTNCRNQNPPGLQSLLFPLFIMLYLSLYARQGLQNFARCTQAKC